MVLNSVLLAIFSLRTAVVGGSPDIKHFDDKFTWPLFIRDKNRMR
jgi:hypothetical protein